MTWIPHATYRLQLHHGFGFRDVEAITSYLRRLGISHAYTSPYLQARPGSTHGYDVVNHASLNPELGSADDHRRMVEAFRSNGLGHILDVVPNHMGVGGSDNPLWLDVLEWGQESPYAGWFDIDWESHNGYLQGKILVPFLGDQYGTELSAGRLLLQFDAQRGEFAVWAYGTHKLPIFPMHYDAILGDALPALETLGDDFAALGEWRPDIFRRATMLKQQLADLARREPEPAEEIAAAVRRFNANLQPGPRPELQALIEQQHWRASHFRVAGDDINYRRFFNVNELAGLRVELPAVFDHTHQLVLQLVRQGYIDGLRVDHIDGLMDPSAYLTSLKNAWGAATPRDNASEPYLLVEKILAQAEALPSEWPVHGTTGYDFCDLSLQLLVDPSGEPTLTQCYNTIVGANRSFADVVRDSKLRVMDNEMAAELNVLARAAARVARLTPMTADFTSALLLRAIRAIIACLPVYRTYVHPGTIPSTEDVQRIGSAVELARHFERELDPSVFTFLERLFTGQLAEPRSGYVRHRVLRCAMRVQQYSGPVMAKGQEDTAFYRYNRFIALNEVGSNAAVFGVPLDIWHRSMAHRASQLPYSMLTTSTHDTKRGEDTRARLAVLSELPGEWQRYVHQWIPLLLAAAEQESAGLDPNDLYGLLQMLLGSCPVSIEVNTPDSTPALAEYRDRFADAVRKSLREAKVHSTWTRPDEQYEERMLRVFDTALRPQLSSGFWRSFSPFLRRVSQFGVDNSLALVTLKLTAPGVPDIYQGCETWNFALMDPDNRRAPHYELHAEYLEDFERCPIAQRPQRLRTLRKNWQDGRVKLWVTHALLQLRTRAEPLFRDGGYEPLSAEGKRGDDVCAYARRHYDSFAVVLVGRFPTHASNGWHNTRVTLTPPLAALTLVDAITGRVLPPGGHLSLEDAFVDLPVAVFVPHSYSDRVATPTPS
jgi:(1->4)-alpha-D-glucan 1-alpha-D-glucosylmutase